MRLLNTKTHQLEEHFGKNIPLYAILSHTWDDDEVTFQDVQTGSLPTLSNKKGYEKIVKTCQLAQQSGLTHCWVDTCCIDKSSSSELNEAINSMYSWYLHARLCYVWLSDFQSSSDSLASCRWFTRGWTLQELIAPPTLEVYDYNWRSLGTKTELAGQFSQITGIDEAVLHDSTALRTIPVGKRLSWAAKRQATRDEDLAYCLLGIFDVNMPMLYGEGSRAFLRLQEEIIKQSNDLSIFAWKASSDHKYRGILAESPAEFFFASDIVSSEMNNPEFTMTNKGVRIVCPLGTDGKGTSILCLNCHWQGSPERLICVYLRMFGSGVYVRTRPHELGSNNGPVLGREAQRYLSKTVFQEHGSGVRESRENAFLFDFDFGNPLFQCDSTTPSALWDRENKIFHRDGRASFTAYHMFKSDWASFNGQFVLAFGIRDDHTSWVSLASPDSCKAVYQAALRGDILAVGNEAIKNQRSWVELKRQSTTTKSIETNKDDWKTYEGSETTTRRIDISMDRRSFQGVEMNHVTIKENDSCVVM